MFFFADIRKTEEGYLCRFKAAKQSGPVKYSEFLIPKKPDNVEGIDWFHIFDTYVEAVNKEVAPKPDQEVFYTGRLFTNQPSRFVRSYLGIKELRNIPNFIANWLKLEDAHLYTGKKNFFLECANSHVKCRREICNCNMIYLLHAISRL